jgi:hypothetical protein
VEQHLTGLQDRHDINPVNQNILSKPEGGNAKYKEATETFIGCAYRVYNKMGLDFRESVYEK